MRQHEPRSSRRFRAKFSRSARSRDDLDVSDYRVKVMLAAIQAEAAENVRARTRNSPVAVLCQRYTAEPFLAATVVEATVAAANPYSMSE